MSAADMAQTIQTLALNVRLSCQLLDVPESSYYERINRHPSKTQLRRQYLSLKISQLLNANRGIYGAPKIHHLLLKQGEKVGLKLVQKLMKQLQLKSVVIKKFKPGYSLSDHINRKNLIQTEPTKKNKVWSTDITYIPIQTSLDELTKSISEEKAQSETARIKAEQEAESSAIAEQQESYADNQNNYQPQVIQETPAVSSNADSSVTSGGSYGVIYPRHK